LKQVADSEQPIIPGAESPDSCVMAGLGPATHGLSWDIRQRRG
jgi:hypothetical protein